jgi:hypothetical protein
MFAKFSQGKVHQAGQNPTFRGPALSPASGSMWGGVVRQTMGTKIICGFPRRLQTIVHLNGSHLPDSSMVCSINHFCNGNTTTHSVYVVELHVTVNYIKMLSAEQQCFCSSIISPDNNETYVDLHVNC